MTTPGIHPFKQFLLEAIATQEAEAKNHKFKGLNAAKYEAFRKGKAAGYRDVLEQFEGLGLF